MDVKDNQAIANASAALGLIEQLALVASDLGEYEVSVPKLHRPELVIIRGRLDSLIRLLNEEESLPDFAQSLQLSGRISSKIERLRLGGEVVRLRELGRLTIDEIATHVDLSPSTISTFLKFYDRLKEPQKARYQKASIFDTTNQYEDLGQMIYRQLARLENVDAEHHVKYIAELRMTIKAAQDWMDRVAHANKIEELKAVVAEILMRYVPEADRAHAIRAIQQAGMRTSTPHSAMVLNP